MEITRVEYPEYITYADAKLTPTVLHQEFPRPILADGKTFYPPNQVLNRYLVDRSQQLKFGAACFCGFLEDTIEVEHCLVIPAVVTVRRLPYNVPLQAEQDLYKTATDEGFHAEQALQYLGNLRAQIGLPAPNKSKVPLFLRRLDEQRAAVKCDLHRDLITVLNGVVTETRISIELSRFASDNRLADSVRRICRTHSQDEVIHASQFKALGTWLWQVFDGTTRAACAEYFVASTIARNMPDIDRMIDCLAQATQLTHQECVMIVCDAYTEKVLIDELMISAKPTVKFLQDLGVMKYISFDEALKREEERQREEIAVYRERARADTFR